MFTHTRRWIAAAAVLAGTTAPLVTTTAAHATSPHAPADHVVVIALDGFDVDYLDDAPMPNLRALAHRGTLTTSTGVMTSITNPSWSSIATGAWPSTHRNTAYYYDAAAGVARGQVRDLAVPTIAQAVRAQGGTVFSAQWFIVQNYGTAFGDPQGLYTQPGGTCSHRVDDLVSVLRGEPVTSNGQQVTMDGIPELMAVYCDTLDAIGHEGGDADPRIPAALSELDGQIGRIVQETKDAGIYGRTAFVITGDHGMTTFDKGFGAEGLQAIADAGYTAQILTSGQRPAPGTDVAVVVGGVASVHLLGDAAADPNAVPRIKGAFEALPQVSAVYDKSAQAAMHMSPNYGELVVEPEPGWSFGSTPARAAGRHGATTELHVPLLLAGAGVLPGHQPASPRHVDIAPTIAALLGIEPPSGAEGRVLTEALRPGA